MGNGYVLGAGVGPEGARLAWPLGDVRHWDNPIYILRASPPILSSIKTFLPLGEYILVLSNSACALTPALTPNAYVYACAYA